MSARRARALTAWLDEAEGQRLRGRPADPARAGAASARLAARPAVPSQDGLLAPLPAALQGHLTRLRQSPGAAPMFGEGWEVVMVTDLGRLVAAQPTVFVDPVPGESRPALDPGDPARVALLALPLAPPAAEIPANFDDEQQIWRISSAHPNVRVTGRFGGELAPGTLGFGFLVQVLTSFMSVAELNGRLVLRDGYHRAHGLLSAGIKAAPAFFRRFADGEQPFRGGMLPASVFLGGRPPTLADFSDPVLSEEVAYAPGETTIYVQMLPPGLAVGRTL